MRAVAAANRTRFYFIILCFIPTKIAIGKFFYNLSLSLSVFLSICVYLCIFLSPLNFVGRRIPPDGKSPHEALRTITSRHLGPMRRCEGRCDVEVEGPAKAPG